MKKTIIANTVNLVFICTTLFLSVVSSKVFSQTIPNKPDEYQARLCSDPKSTVEGDIEIVSEDSYKDAQSIICVKGRVNITYWGDISSLQFAELKFAGEIHVQGQAGIVGISFPKLEAANRLFIGSPSYPNASITSLEFPALEFAQAIQLGGDIELPSLDFPVLKQVAMFKLSDLKKLTSFKTPQLKTGTTIYLYKTPKPALLECNQCDLR